MGTFPRNSYLTIFQPDLDNQIGKRKYLVKKSWVENVPNQAHTNLNYFARAQKVKPHSKIHLVHEGR